MKTIPKGEPKLCTTREELEKLVSEDIAARAGYFIGSGQNVVIAVYSNAVMIVTNPGAGQSWNFVIAREETQ